MLTASRVVADLVFGEPRGVLCLGPLWGCDTRSHEYLSGTIRCSATGTVPGRASGVTLGGVRSSRDNVASVHSDWQLNRKGTLRLPASQGGRELGLEGMANSGVRHEVARVFVRDDPVFCHRYRTGTCVEGNLGVRSSRDNVASARLSRQRNREGTLRLPASQGGRELGLEGRVNSGELLLSRRNSQQAKEAERLEPKGTWPGRGGT